MNSQGYLGKLKLMETTNLPPMPDPSAQQSDSSSSGQGQKKAILNKLISNLLGKPGRSMHEMINGIKDAIGAYKNYAKEWDTLNGIVAPGATGDTPDAPSADVGGAPRNSIQTILDQIKQQKGTIPNQAPMSTSLPSMPPKEMPAMPTSLPPMQSKAPMTPMPQMPPAIPPQGPTPNGAGGPGLIAGQPQTSTFNRPAPVSNLGIHGF